MATQSNQCPSSETLSQDIRTFVHKQEEENKELLSENKEANELVIQWIALLLSDGSVLKLPLNHVRYLVLRHLASLRWQLKHIRR